MSNHVNELLENRTRVESSDSEGFNFPKKPTIKRDVRNELWPDLYDAYNRHTSIAVRVKRIVLAVCLPSNLTWPRDQVTHTKRTRARTYARTHKYNNHRRGYTLGFSEK